MPEILSNVPLPFLVLQACQAFELRYLQEVDLEVHQLLVQCSVYVRLPADTGGGHVSGRKCWKHINSVSGDALGMKLSVEDFSAWGCIHLQQIHRNFAHVHAHGIISLKAPQQAKDEQHRNAHL